MSLPRKKLLIATSVLLAGLALIYILPKTYNMRESAVIMTLPSKVSAGFAGELGGWFGSKILPSKLELDSLADDTKAILSFAEDAGYDTATPRAVDEILLTLYGADGVDGVPRPAAELAAAINAQIERNNLAPP